MADERKVLPNGELDGRGHAPGSQPFKFKKGHKGPGRPKGSKSLRTIYREAAKMKVTHRRGEEDEKSFTTVEAIVLKQREKAVKGDQRAAERFLEKLESYEPPEVDTKLLAQLLEEDADILAQARARGLIAPESDSGEDQ